MRQRASRLVIIAGLAVCALTAPAGARSRHVHHRRAVQRFHREADRPLAPQNSAAAINSRPASGFAPGRGYRGGIPAEVSPRYRGEQGCDAVRSALNQCFPYH